MLELTEDQSRLLEVPNGHPMRIVDLRTRETFVLLTLAEYQQLKEIDYDDSPMTREELEAVAWETLSRSESLHGEYEEYNTP